jgi:hypothetical protein
MIVPFLPQAAQGSLAAAAQLPFLGRAEIQFHLPQETPQPKTAAALPVCGARIWTKTKLCGKL